MIPLINSSMFFSLILPSGVMSFLKRFRNKGKSGEEKKPAGEAQMRMLRSLPKILKYVPGTAQDLRVFFLSLQYWLSGSKENIYSLEVFY